MHFSYFHPCYISSTVSYVIIRYAVLYVNIKFDYIQFFIIIIFKQQNYFSFHFDKNLYFLLDMTLCDSLGAVLTLPLHR